MSICRAIRWCTFAVAGLVLIGCGGDGKPPTVPAGGKVTYKKSQPAAGAMVVFHPQDPALEKRIGGKPVARLVNADGSFQLSTYTDGDGAPEGTYGVTIQWGVTDSSRLSLSSEGKSFKSKINEARFGNPQKPFATVTIKKGEKNEFEFDVE